MRLYISKEQEINFVQGVSFVKFHQGPARGSGVQRLALRSWVKGPVLGSGVQGSALGSGVQGPA